MACTQSLELDLAIFHNTDILLIDSSLPSITLAFRFGKNSREQHDNDCVYVCFVFFVNDSLSSVRLSVRLSVRPSRFL